MEDKTLKEKVTSINEILKTGEPNNFSADHKNYTGYKPQPFFDAVNQELLGEWGVEVMKHELVTTQRKDKKTNEMVDVLNALVHVRISVEGIAFDAFASHPVLDDVGDSFKSAQTDATKKAFSMLSIGNRAYHGLLKKTGGKEDSVDLDF